MFSYRAHREKPVLILDVEGGSVAVAVALVKLGSPIRVILSERASIPPQERAQDHHTTAIVSLLRETLSRILKQYTDSPASHEHGSVQEPHVIVGVPWIRSRSVLSEELYPSEKVITDGIIKNLAKEALKQPSAFNDANIFESSVTRVQLNGYPTAKPAGKRAHHITVTVFQSEIVSDLKQAIEAAIHELLPGRAVDFRSASRVALTALHEQAHTNHYLYIAMGSTDTECVAVHKEDVNEHTVVSMGTSMVTLRLAGENGLSEEVLSLLRMLSSDTCAAPACAALKVNLAKLEPELVKAFGDAFATIASRRKIPNVCFLAAHPDLAPWLEHFFARIDFAQFTVTAQPLSVTPLTPDHLRDQVIWTGTREDTGLGLAAAFVNTLNN